MTLASHHRRRRQAVAAGLVVIGAAVAAAAVLWATGMLKLLALAGVDAFLLVELVAVIVLVTLVWVGMMLWTLDLLEEARADLADDLDDVERDAELARARRRADRAAERAARPALVAVPDAAGTLRLHHRDARGERVELIPVDDDRSA